jgi:hypothetical protein
MAQKFLFLNFILFIYNNNKKNFFIALSQNQNMNSLFFWKFNLNLVIYFTFFRLKKKLPTYGIEILMVINCFTHTLYKTHNLKN